MICFVSCSLFGNAILVLYYNSMSLSQAYENVALNKTAYQTNQYKKGNDSFDASNAVDGLKSNLHWNGGQCAVSAIDKETATWWVDLGTIHRIHHITLYYRTENIDWDYRNNATSSFLGFSLYVSNTTNRLQGTLCFKDDYFNTSSIPSVFNTTCKVQGQYVIYYNERLQGVTYPSDYNEHAENDLCEVEVYGCPIPSNCLVSNTITCQCPKCKPGFSGTRCELECDVGHYGYNCNETCGHCMDKLQCSHVEGTCQTGCKAGYFGQTCKEVDKDKVMAVPLYSLIGVVCFLVITNGALILYIVLTRMSIARNNVRQQQNKEINPAYDDTIDAFQNTEAKKEYMEIGEPSYINMDDRGLF